jgi:hypothetical protein
LLPDLAAAVCSLRKIDYFDNIELIEKHLYSTACAG